MSFFLKWLRIERPESAALHPSRTLDVPAAYDEVFNRCIEGIERVLGGIVRETDRASGHIEATFGLVFSERLTCALERLDDRRTRVRIESRRLAQSEQSVRSDYVAALEAFLKQPPA